MTAEIALINRRAVTLAADSAISLVGPGNDIKIFNSAEKIFELCNHAPVGLMIYNNVDFLLAPLEILARDFRATVAHPFADVFECAEEFLGYLSRHAGAASERVRSAAISQRVVAVLEELRERALEQYANTVGGGSRFASVLFQVLNSALIQLQSRKQIASHADVDWGEVYAQHGVSIDEAIEACRQQSFGFEDQDVKLLREISCRALLSSNFGDGFTGIVVAGYGRTDMYPGLVAYEIDGFICGRLRKIIRHKVQIRPELESLGIVTFAQEDISRRLLDGIDPEIIVNIRRHISGSLAIMRRAVLANVPPEVRAQVERDFDTAASKMRNGIKSTLNAFVEGCNSDFDATVAAMPKQEMAFFAEALVNTTAMKRRVSRDREDVGGPVDVAVISRHDGFVWVKRKHYFEAEMNPRYFRRMSGKVYESGGVSDGPKA